jgi:hypothetical protein
MPISVLDQAKVTFTETITKPS